MCTEKYFQIHVFRILRERKKSMKSGCDLIKIRTKASNKTHTKVKSEAISNMYDDIVMSRRKLSFDWLKTHVTKQRFG